MGKAKVRVTYQLLASLKGLCFPEGTEIERVYDTPLHEVFEIVVTHPDLPAVREGEQLLCVDPQYASVLVDGEHYEPRFISWNPE